MATAILLRGNSGSGKSTVARILQQQLGRGTLIIPQDIVRREMLYVRDRPGNPAVSLMTEMARWGSRNCETVIVEGIMDAELYAPLFQTIRAEFTQVYAYYYDLPFEETLRRHMTKPNCADFGEAEMRNWWKERDLIGFIPETLIGSEPTPEQVVEMILQELQP